MRAKQFAHPHLTQVIKCSRELLCGVKFLIRYAHKNFLPELAYFLLEKEEKIMAPLGTAARKQRRLLAIKKTEIFISVFFILLCPRLESNQE